MKQKRKENKNATKIPKRRSVVYISAQFECRLQYLFVLCNVNRIEWKIFRNKITAQDTLRSFADPPGTVKLPSKWQIHIHACDMYMNIWWVRCLSNECSSKVCKDPCCEPWQTNKCLTCLYKHTRWGTLMKYFKLCISIWFRYMAQIVKSISNITIKKISCELKRKCKLAVFAWVCPLRSY